MANDIAVKFDNVGKLYKLGEIGTGTLSKDLNQWYARVRKRENPYAKIGTANITHYEPSDEVWALKDINFEIKKGDIVGILGKNGAGKSTMLKILSKVTKPSTGKIYLNGSVASLLEVGTGFHPEMTGRENVYLNGAILGMMKQEIDKKFDQIVDFSGVEKYIDTPVKRYSSGMYVRLGFAVAAHLEPDILIVDEVLAVGDASFQKKCIGKMKDVSYKDGRTVLFVSHNISSVQSLCNTGILFENGMVKKVGSIDHVIQSYKNSYDDNLATHIDNFSQYPNNDLPLFKPIEFSLTDLSYERYSLPFRADSDVFIKVIFNAQETNAFMKVGIRVYNDLNELLFLSFHNDKATFECPNIRIGENIFIIKIPRHFLNEGDYIIELLAHVEGSPNFWQLGKGPQLNLSIQGGLSESKIWTYKRRGTLAPILDFKNLADE